jgi:uncharacterized repeat protein (TIGR03803 family)
MLMSGVKASALHPRRSVASAFIAALALLAVTATPAAAQGFKVLHVFCENQTCPDGFTPSALAADGAGNFFGTTRGGGPHGGGTVFELMRRDDGSYKFKTLYGFCAQANCLDGQLINGPPVIDVAGNLYGTALAGGETGYNGDVWELKRNGKLKVLHSFCTTDCADGAEPMAALTYLGAASGALYDGKSPLYGVTPFGGGTRFQGAAFQLTPDGNSWDFQTLYTFCPDGGNCVDGAVPSGPLLPDASGNLYGMTYGGGSNTRGTVYRLSQSGGIWSESALYSFCQQANCVDGEQPYGTLALDGSGNLFGTASAGGGSCSQNSAGCGVAFKLAPNGQSWQQTVLHSFCSQAKCADGGTPMDGPFVAANGDLVGTAQFGGNASSQGVVWRLSGGQFQTLHKFCKGGDCGKGENPAAVLVPDASGHLVGTTQYGGPNFGGVIYEITP